MGYASCFWRFRLDFRLVFDIKKYLDDPTGSQNWLARLPMSSGSPVAVPNDRAHPRRSDRGPSPQSVSRDTLFGARSLTLA